MKEVTKMDKREKNDRMANAPLGKLMLEMALPTVFAQIVNLLYNMVDRMYVGRIPETGHLALAGLGVAFPIIMLISAFAALIGAGGAPRAAICMGKKENAQAEKILGTCISTLCVLAIALCVIFSVVKEPLLMLFGASNQTIDYAVSYLSIYLLGTISVQISLGLNMFITCQGFAKTGMLTVLIGAVINIILDPIFIFGLNMGVRGGALATVLSQALSCIWVLTFLMGKKTQLRLRPNQFGLQKAIILPCVGLGTSTFIMQSSEGIISVCFNSSLLKYGGDIAVGAMTILTSVMMFAMLPLQGLGQGAQPIISYNYGARNPERVKKAFWLLLKVSMAYATLLWLFIMIFPRGFAGLFTTDAALLDFTKRALRIYLACLFLFGIQISCQMAFNSIGYAKESIMVAVMRKFVLLIPLIYIIPHFWTGDQVSAVYMAEPVADFFAVSFTVFLFRKQFKKALESISGKKDVLNA